MSQLPRGYRNNNPGNLKRQDSGNPYRGEIRPSSDSVFRQFETMQWGYRAMFHLLIIRYMLDWNKTTIRQILNTYAPTSENDTSGYIAFVADRMGISPDAELNPSNHNQMISLGAAICRMENGIEPNMQVLTAGYNLLANNIQYDPDGNIDDQELLNEGRNPRDYRNAIILATSAAIIAGVFLWGKKAGKNQ